MKTKEFLARADVLELIEGKIRDEDCNMSLLLGETKLLPVTVLSTDTKAHDCSVSEKGNDFYWVSWLASDWQGKVYWSALYDSCTSWDETMEAVRFIEGNHKPVCLWVEKESGKEKSFVLFRVYVDSVGLHRQQEVWRNE